MFSDSQMFSELFEQMDKSGSFDKPSDEIYKSCGTCDQKYCTANEDTGIRSPNKHHQCIFNDYEFWRPKPDTAFSEAEQAIRECFADKSCDTCKTNKYECPNGHTCFANDYKYWQPKEHDDLKPRTDNEKAKRDMKNLIDENRKYKKEVDRLYNSLNATAGHQIKLNAKIEQLKKSQCVGSYSCQAVQEARTDKIKRQAETLKTLNAKYKALKDDFAELQNKSNTLSQKLEVAHGKLGKSETKLEQVQAEKKAIIKAVRENRLCLLCKRLDDNCADCCFNKMFELDISKVGGEE